MPTPREIHPRVPWAPRKVCAAPPSADPRSIVVLMMLFRKIMIFAACASSACTSPPAEPLRADELAAAPERRTESPETVRAALAAADLGPLWVRAPELPPTLDGDDGRVWEALAYVYEPGVRQARARVLAARATAGTLGSPGPVELDDNNKSFRRRDYEIEVALTFDLLGVLGLGRAGAERELARAEVLEATAALESALWTAKFRAERARVRVALLAEKEASFRELMRQAEEDRTRINILAAHGRIPSTDLAWSKAIEHEAEQRASRARSDLAMARAELCEATGVAPDSPLVRGVGAKTLADFERAVTADCALPAAVELYHRVPALRWGAVRYALAEAELRAEVAQQYPSLRVGPQPIFRPGETLLGAVAAIDVPFPGSRDGAIAAAVERRTAARQALEDALLRTTAQAAACRTQLHEAARRRDEQALPIDAAAESMWKTGRTLFRNGAVELDRWSFNLEHRMEPMENAYKARLDAVDAMLQWRETCAADLAEPSVAAAEVRR